MGRSRAILVLAALSLFVSLLVPYESPSGDATCYGVVLRDTGLTRVNPNRLLLEPSVYGIYRIIARVAGHGSVDALTLLLWISRLAHVASGLLVFAIMRQLTSHARVAWVVALGYVSSFAILYFATDAEPILLAHLPLLAGGALHVRAWRHRTLSAHVGAGIAYGLSVLMYVSNVIPVAVVGAVSLVASLRARTALIAPITACGIAALGTLVAHAVSGTSLPIEQWLVSYGGGTASMSYGGNAILSLFRVVFGLGSSLVASRGAARLVRRWSEGAESIDPHPGDGIELAIWAAALAVAGLLTILAILEWRKSRGLERGAFAACFASATALFLFNSRWIGSDPQFWVPVVPLLWIVWGFGLARFPRATNVAALAIVVLVLPYNVFREVRPLRGDPRPKIQRVELMNLTNDGSLIITPGLDWVATLCRYHTMGQREVLSLWGLSVEPKYAGNWTGYLEALETRIAQAFAEGTNVYIRGVVEEAHPEGVPWREMAPRGFPLPGLQTWLGRFAARPAFTVGGDVYWQLSAAAPLNASVGDEAPVPEE